MGETTSVGLDLQIVSIQTFLNRAEQRLQVCRVKSAKGDLGHVNMRSLIFSFSPSEKERKEGLIGLLLGPVDTGVEQTMGKRFHSPSMSQMLQPPLCTDVTETPNTLFCPIVVSRKRYIIHPDFVEAVWATSFLFLSSSFLTCIPRGPN